MRGVRLKYLQLGRNKLEGSAPTSIGELSMLISLKAEYNQLQGSIPFCISELQVLKDSSEVAASF